MLSFTRYENRCEITRMRFRVVILEWHSAKKKKKSINISGVTPHNKRSIRERRLCHNIYIYFATIKYFPKKYLKFPNDCKTVIDKCRWLWEYRMIQYFPSKLIGLRSRFKLILYRQLVLIQKKQSWRIEKSVLFHWFSEENNFHSIGEHNNL